MAHDREEIIFAKVDAHLDSNPKIRKAGRDAREVFQFILRRNALMKRSGTVPLSNIEPEYLADVLMMTQDEARNGVSRCVTASLLLVDVAQKTVSIVGWHPDWGRNAKSNAERQAAFRSRNKAEIEVLSNGSNETPLRVTGSNESNGSEVEGEVDKKGRRPRKTQPPPDHQPAVAAFDLYFRHANGDSKPTWGPMHISMVKTLVRKHSCAEVIRRIRVLETAPPDFPPQPWDLATFVKNFDRCAQPHGGKQKDRQQQIWDSEEATP